METKTLQDAIAYFSDPTRAFQYALNFRWENGVVSCPRCGSEKHSFIKTRKIWFCYGCNKQFSLKVGTIFEDSPLGLDKWMMVMWMLANCKNGISSYEVSRAIGITQRSAWFMLHRIRTVMTEVSTEKLGGNAPVEIDETFIGGKVKNIHKRKLDRSKSYTAGGGKAIVLGMLERGGKVRAGTVKDRKKDALLPPIAANVELGSHIITDEHSTYPFVARGAYTHEIINHCEGYVRNHVHTNGIENFWSLLKRGLNGTYISVEPFHLDAYVAEQVFRYNNRKDMNDQGRFHKVLGSVAGRRLTYATLTSAGSATSH